MRLAPLLALLLAAPALHAQADPNPPEAYYPLHVGDVWEYGTSGPAVPSPYTVSFERREVVGDSVAGGYTYAVVQTQQYRFEPTGWVRDDTRALFRFDAALASVVVRRTDGSELDIFGCRLDLPFPGGACAGPGPFAAYTGSPEATVQIGGSSLTTSVRRLDGAVPGPTLAAGIGDLGRDCEGTCAPLELRFARVAGAAYGTPVEFPSVGANVPDPTPPQEYYPLAVGSRWEYEDCQTVLGSAGCVPNALFVVHQYVRREIVRDTVVAGTRYAVEAQRRYEAADQSFTGASERLLRFDAATATVLQRGDAGGDFPITCPLDAAFNSTFGDDGPCARVHVTGAAGVSKGFQFLEGGEGYRAGVGFTGSYYGGPGSSSEFTLRYARIGGAVVFGTPLITVAGETGASAAAALALAAAPNPTTGALRLALVLPEAQTVRLEAVDALGRRVWQQTAALGAGAQFIPMDASAWAPGVYVVRASAGSASASARVVRR